MLRPPTVWHFFSTRHVRTRARSSHVAGVWRADPSHLKSQADPGDGRRLVPLRQLPPVTSASWRSVPSHPSFSPLEQLSSNLCALLRFSSLVASLSISWAGFVNRPNTSLSKRLQRESVTVFIILGPCYSPSHILLDWLHLWPSVAFAMVSIPSILISFIVFASLSQALPTCSTCSDHRHQLLPAQVVNVDGLLPENKLSRTFFSVTTKLPLYID